MIGVILAAGMAKRLRPLTDECPKCLLKIGERTLLQRTVDAMLQAGITELVVVTGYRAEISKQTTRTEAMDFALLGTPCRGYREYRQTDCCPTQPRQRSLLQESGT